MKRIKSILVIAIFILSVISHFMYGWFPNKLFSVLFPVNESIWEHMKLIATPTLVFSIFEYFIYRKKNIKFNNFIFSYAISIILGIISYLILYIPLDNIFGHHIYIAVSLLFLIFILVEVVSYYIMNYKQIRYSNIIGLFLIIGLYIIFGYFTYYPPQISLFYDYMNKQYGINQSS